MTSNPSPLHRQREFNAYSDQLQQELRSQIPPIPASVHNLVDEYGQRQARLVILLDSQGRAIEAELYYDWGLSSQARNKVHRLAKNLLSTGYTASGPDTPIATFDLGQQLDRDNVANRYAADQEPDSINVLYVVAGIVVLFVIVGILFAMLNVIFRSRQDAAAPTATPALVVASPTAAASNPAAIVDPAALTVQTNNLPPSRNANANIGVNMTVRIRDQLKSFVRSQPGSDQGQAVGFMQDGETALVLGGPQLLPGDSDTIVWWYVQLNDGTQGWTPANTSTLALLEPVQ